MTTNNSLQHAIAITERVQIANSMYAGMFEARDLGDDQPGFGHLDVNERLDLKTIAPEASVTIGSRGSVASSPSTAAWRRQKTLKP